MAGALGGGTLTFLRRLATGLALLAVPALVGYGVHRGLGLPTRPAVPAAGEGKRLYDLNCLPCHGAAGRGGVANPNARGGKIPPLDTVGSTYTDAELLEKALAGVPDPEPADPRRPPPPHPMPSWEGRFTGPEQQALVGYLKSLAADTTERW